MQKYTLHNRGKIIIGIIAIALLCLVFIPTEYDRREDKIDELVGEAGDQDTTKYYRTQQEIDSLFSVIDQEYANETSHDDKMDLQYQRRLLELANNINELKLCTMKIAALERRIKRE